VNRRIEVTEDQREIKRKKRVIEYAEKNGIPAIDIDGAEFRWE
jgi:3,4-dihydroxy-2-butanone 4-phosphate synthase